MKVVKASAATHGYNENIQRHFDEAGQTPTMALNGDDGNSIAPSTSISRHHVLDIEAFLHKRSAFL
jgi:hypothetical protein